MSSVPYYSPKQRFGSKYGHETSLDGIIQDGLWDVYNQFLMGDAAELCAKEHGFSRQDQDDYAISSYQKAQKATLEGAFHGEIVSIEIPGSRGKPSTLVSSDDEVKNVSIGTLPRTFFILLPFFHSSIPSSSHPPTPTYTHLHLPAPI